MIKADENEAEEETVCEAQIPLEGSDLSISDLQIPDNSSRSHLNTQALGMIYWGLSKNQHYLRGKFHRLSEKFIE